MIRIIEAKKSYLNPLDLSGTSNTSIRVEALRGIYLTIPSGEFLAITGPSGCGKSTLLHLLGGLDQLSSGEIYLGERALHRMGEEGLTELRRTHVGIVFQFFNLLPTLSAEENVQLPALLQGQSNVEAGERAQVLLEEVGLWARRRHQPHELSGGEMQRVALARALIMNPPVLLADEPTGNLDSESSQKVIALFQKLGRTHGTTIVMVTHSPEVAQVADRTIAMRDGQIVK